MIIFLTVVLAGFLYLWNEAYGAETGSVVINEVAWMGSPDDDGGSNWRDEWIELYNATDSSISLDGWKLLGEDSNDDEPWEISLSGTIPAKGFILLDNKFGDYLNNEGENLALRDNSANTVDNIGAITGWPAGDNDTKETMALVDGVWVNGPVGGTPGEKNSNTEPEPEPEPELESEPTPQEKEASSPSNEDEGQASEQENEHSSEYSSESSPNIEESEPKFEKTFNIVISEFMPSPEGPDSENEWIELLNTGEEAIDISGWMLDDMEGGSRPYAFPEGTNILPGEYRVFSAKITNIALNNSGDRARLLFPDNAIADEVKYGKADEAYSYALLEDKWVWTDNATPGSVNRGPSPKSPAESAASTRTKENTKTNSEQTQDKEKENDVLTTEEFSAQVSQGDSSTPDAAAPFIFGILVAGAGGAGFFFLRRKIE